MILPYLLPKIVDANSDLFDVQIVEDIAKKFVIYNKKKNQLEFLQSTLTLS